MSISNSYWYFWLITFKLDLLGTRIGRDVHRNERMWGSECDLLALQDGYSQTLRGFCDERDGYFRLAPVTIGTKAVVNAYTNISPGASIADGAVYGLRASLYKTFLKDHTPERSYTPLLHGSNQTLLPDPSWPLSSSLLIISILLYL